VQPAYPDEARRAGVSGRVILEVLVDPAGGVAAVKPIRTPYGGEALLPAAIEAVQRWSWRPATRDGKPVACWTVASVEFYPPPAAPPPPKGKKKVSGRETAAPPAAAGDAATAPGPGADSQTLPATGAEDATPPPPAAPAPGPDERGADASAPAGAGPAVVESPAAPAKPPEPWPAAGRVIRPESGGPEPLRLGGPGEAIAGLPAVVERLDGGTRLRAAALGVEVRLDAAGAVERIRYVFDATGGFQASPWRTRSGLGAGSSCRGIPPAHGRPDERVERSGDDGRQATLHVHRRGGARFTFLCAGDRLVELLVERADGNP
jgi:TonB family protein